MKKAVCYILPLGYTVIVTFMAWCVLYFSAVVVSLAGGFNQFKVYALIGGGMACFAALIALGVCNYCFIDYHPNPKLTLCIEALECVLLFPVLMAFWETVFNAVV